MFRFDLTWFVLVLAGFAFDTRAAGTLFDNWRLATSAQVKVTLIGNGFPSAKGAAVAGTEFAVFDSGWTYAGTDWINRNRLCFLYRPDATKPDQVCSLTVQDLRARVNFKTATSYTAEYDCFLLDAADEKRNKVNAAFLARTGYTQLLEQLLTGAPAITGTAFLLADDSGKLIRRGKAIKGTKHIVFYALWNDPADPARHPQARVDVTVRYTGSRYPVTSACCISDAAQAAQNQTDSEAFLAATEG